MLYREIEHVTDDGNWTEKEYEGTPQEIAELINKTRKIQLPSVPKMELPKIPDINIPNLAKEISRNINENTIRSSRGVR